MSNLNPLKLLSLLRMYFRLTYTMPYRLSKLEESMGRLHAERHRSLVSDNLQAYEFRAFSQWGEDGIIQHLLERVKPEPEIFIEFGVENYLEACTRFLLVNNNWRGLIADGSTASINFIHNDPIYWRYDLTAVQAFITRENINQIFTDNGVAGPIGLLVVDIDGNDYWVWEAITSVDPILVVCEYNTLFGPTAKVSIPYKADFVRTDAHPSNLYFGASLAALTHLAKQKGYILVGSNSHGGNAFFVKADRAADLREVTPEEAYVKAKFREARDANGQLTFTRFEQARTLIADMPLVDVVTGQSLRVSDLES